MTIIATIKMIEWQVIYDLSFTWAAYTTKMASNSRKQNLYHLSRPLENVTYSDPAFPLGHNCFFFTLDATALSIFSFNGACSPCVFLSILKSRISWFCKNYKFNKLYQFEKSISLNIYKQIFFFFEIPHHFPYKKQNETFGFRMFLFIHQEENFYARVTFSVILLRWILQMTDPILLPQDFH